MSKLHQQSEENRSAESDVFYPKGFIVAGFPGGREVSNTKDALHVAGFGEADVTVVKAADMARQAKKNIDSAGLLAGLGASIKDRHNQLALAEEGHDFLLIKAEEDDDEAKAISVLGAHDTVYAIKYRTLVVENLLGHFKPGANRGSFDSMISKP